MTDYGTPSTYGSDPSTYGSDPTTESSSPSATERARDVAGSAAQEAGGVAGTAVDQTKAVASTAADQTRMVAHDAKDRAREFTHEARGKLKGQVNDQASRVGRSLADVGQQLRTMAEKADDPESTVTKLTRQAADGVEQLASRLEGGGVDQVMYEVKRFARNRPAVFLVGAVGAGFVLGRLVKAVDFGEVMKGPESTDRAVGGWDRELELPAEASTATYDTFATTPVPSTYDTGAATGTTTYPGSTGTTPYPPESTAPSSVPTYSDPQTSGYPATPPVAPAEDEWGRT